MIPDFDGIVLGADDDGDGGAVNSKRKDMRFGEALET